MAGKYTTSLAAGQGKEQGVARDGVRARGVGGAGARCQVPAHAGACAV